MRLGFGEILIVLVVVLLIFGANKIPQLGDALGKGIRNFRKASGGDDAIDVTPPKGPEQLGQSQRQPQAPAQDARAESRRT
ncbi:MAG TPA: twin-arginine translocase TatA/TatE family subunit [Anaeromyxobacteraceae bacterium]|nr:twin-arginine translocase TatA/TatE family subunit [Anaeromyxobacteraceae bacterium]